MDVLIVGGNSFIGANLQSYLLSRDQGINIISLDVARDTRMEDVMGLNQYQGRYSFKEGGICNLSTYEHYLKVSDLVINCSSIGYRSRFSEGMELFIRTNIQGARMLAESACRYHVPLMHISTDEVYGSCPFTVHRREETAPLDPTNSFAATMAAGERLVSLAGKSSGNPIMIARPCELIGPNQDPDRLVPRTIRSIMGGRPPGIREKGGRDIEIGSMSWTCARLSIFSWNPSRDPPAPFHLRKVKMSIPNQEELSFQEHLLPVHPHQVPENQQRGPSSPVYRSSTSHQR